MGSYPIGIVGESFDNEDGSSRQAEIARCKAGEPVTLERDPQNRYDANCVKVLSTRGIQIGNISRDDDWVCERLDRGGFVDARILRIGKDSKGKRGVVICIRTREDDDWLHDEQTTEETRLEGAPTFGVGGVGKGCFSLLLLIFLPVVIGAMVFG